MRNAHGDVVGLTDSTGAVSKTYDYDAFGNEIAPVDGDRNPFRYCGEFWDNDAGTYYLRARNYAPTIGRFLSEDTHWNVGNMIYGDREYGEGEKKVADIRAINQALNLYAYCVSNPVSYVDRDGYFAATLAAGASNFWNPVGWVLIGVGIVATGVYLYKEHTKNKRKSTGNKHQKGQARNQRDHGGEKGDARRTPRKDKRK